MVPIKTPDPLQAKTIDLLHRIRSETGLTVSEIARLAGLSPSTLTRAYPNPSVSYTLSSRSLAKLRAKFPIAAEGESTLEVPVKASRPHRDNYGLETLQIFSLEQFKLPTDVRATIMQRWTGNDEASVEFWLDLKMHCMTTMPFSIGAETNERLFGVHVGGDLMEPRLRAGEIAVIDRLKPVPLMSDVFLRILLQGTTVIMIAQILKRNATNMYFSTPSSSKVFSLSREEIVDIFPIVAVITNSY